MLVAEFAYILLTISLWCIFLVSLRKCFVDYNDWEEFPTILGGLGAIITTAFCIGYSGIAEWCGYNWYMFWNDVATTEIDPIPITLIILSIIAVILLIIEGKIIFKKPECSKCNKKLDRKSQYCPSCGGKV